MNPRLVRWLLALYPRAWRNRYGTELASLSSDLIGTGETTRLLAGVDLVAGAAIERWRALARTWRTALATAAAAIIGTAGVVLAVTHAHQGAAAKPYFDAHPVGGFMLLVVVLGWFVMELSRFLAAQQSREWQEKATKTGAAGWWLAAGACLVAANIWLYLAPPVIPAAAIRPGAAPFTAGMVIFLAGIGLRGWSFATLGRYFTAIILVSPHQPVATSGPYRIVRHPADAGGLLMSIGVGLMSANWVGLAAMTLLPLVVTVWRIHIEENALLATLGDHYRSYASRHKRLVPLVW